MSTVVHQEDLSVSRLSILGSSVIQELCVARLLHVWHHGVFQSESLLLLYKPKLSHSA